MKKTKNLILAFVLICACTFSTFTVKAQLKMKPVIIDVGQYNDKPTFVFKVKANEKFELPERAVTSDFSCLDEAFDPYKMDEYPKWQLSNFTLYNQDGTSGRYVSVKCVTTGKYLYYRQGTMKMIDEDEYDKLLERNDKNQYVNSTETIMRVFFKPIVVGDYIKLGIYNTEGKNLVITPGKWRTREFKLVFVEN